MNLKPYIPYIAPVNMHVEKLLHISHLFARECVQLLRAANLIC